MRNELWADNQTDARTPKSRQEERDRLQRQCDEYVASGKKITQCPPCLFLDTLNNYGESLVF